VSSLDGDEWQLRGCLGREWEWHVTPDKSWEAPGWLPARVPGSVLDDLWRAGEVPDPYVDPDDFPTAVAAACRGGASGMLAGRALWTSVLGADDPTALLRERSVPRLRELAEIVDRFGRPWREAAKHSHVAGDG
jgi:hypothetical protein